MYVFCPFIGKVTPLGGWTEANPEREDIKEVAMKAVEEFNTNSKAKKYFKLLNIRSAHTQVQNFIFHPDFFIIILLLC